MTRFTDSPLLVFVLTVVGLWLMARLGAILLRRVLPFSEKMRDDFGPILAATLTLLGLVIGFSYSMATGHFDRRSSYEASEANAIRTEYDRAGLLPAAADGPRRRRRCREQAFDSKLLVGGRQAWPAVRREATAGPRRSDPAVMGLASSRV